MNGRATRLTIRWWKAAPFPVNQEIALDTPFGNLLHFRKDTNQPQPRVLIVAPMAGHFATLLRPTARTMLADHDVYLTDWKNARDVPLAAGRFGIDDYIDTLIKFLDKIGPGAHVVAVCPTPVPRCWPLMFPSWPKEPATEPRHVP